MKEELEKHFPHSRIRVTQGLDCIYYRIDGKVIIDYKHSSECGVGRQQGRIGILVEETVYSFEEAIKSVKSMQYLDKKRHEAEHELVNLIMTGIEFYEDT